MRRESKNCKKEREREKKNTFSLRENAAMASSKLDDFDDSRVVLHLDLDCFCALLLLEAADTGLSRVTGIAAPERSERRRDNSRFPIG